jgi:excisionase family DNA binding protein
MDERDGANEFHLEPGDLLTAEEVAALLRMSSQGVKAMRKRGEIGGYFTGAGWLFDRRELVQWLAAHRYNEIEQ